MKSPSTTLDEQRRKAELFRALHMPGTPLILFNVWDPGSARVVAAAGARALATGSWSVAHSNGFDDGEQLPLELALDNLRRIVGVVDLPVSVDLEAGYGESPQAVGRTVAAAIEAGAVGCNLEDGVPSVGRIRSVADQSERIRNARQAADAAGLRFFINARTDVFLDTAPESHSTGLVEEARERAHAYAAAGADGFFPPGLSDLGLIASLARDSPLPLNILVADATPPLAQLAAHGVARASYGPRPFRLAMRALEAAAREAHG